MISLEERVCEVIDNNYDLGKIVKIEACKLGETNKNFIIVCEKDNVQKRWFVKRYIYLKTASQLRYELAFGSYYLKRAQQSAMKAPIVVPTRSGDNFVRSYYEGNEKYYYYVVFEYLEGSVLEDWNWRNNTMSADKRKKCNETIASFHRFAYGFSLPGDNGNVIPGMVSDIEKWEFGLLTMVQSMKGNPQRDIFCEFITPKLDHIMQMLWRCQAEYIAAEPSLPKCITHGDINPCNFMFDENENVCGIFDFDWIKKRPRVFDNAWMIHELCTIYHLDDNDAVLPIDSIVDCIKIYNTAVEQASDFPLGGLTDEECAIIPTIILLQMIQIIYDRVCYLYHDQTNEDQYTNIGVSKYALAICEYIEKSHDKIVRTLLETNKTDSERLTIEHFTVNNHGKKNREINIMEV